MDIFEESISNKYIKWSIIILLFILVILSIVNIINNNNISSQISLFEEKYNLTKEQELTNIGIKQQQVLENQIKIQQDQIAWQQKFLLKS